MHCKNGWRLPTSRVNSDVAKVEDAVDAQGVKGKAVVNYAALLTTQQMRYPRLSRRVRNKAIIPPFLDVTRSEFYTIAQKGVKETPALVFKIF